MHLHTSEQPSCWIVCPAWQERSCLIPCRHTLPAETPHLRIMRLHIDWFDCPWLDNHQKWFCSLFLAPFSTTEGQEYVGRERRSERGAWFLFPIGEHILQLQVARQDRCYASQWWQLSYKQCVCFPNLFLWMIRKCFTYRTCFSEGTSTKVRSLLRNCGMNGFPDILGKLFCFILVQWFLLFFPFRWCEWKEWNFGCSFLGYSRCDGVCTYSVETGMASSFLVYVALRCILHNWTRTPTVLAAWTFVNCLERSTLLSRQESRELLLLGKAQNVFVRWYPETCGASSFTPLLSFSRSPFPLPPLQAGSDEKYGQAANLHMPGESSQVWEASSTPSRHWSILLAGGLRRWRRVLQELLPRLHTEAVRLDWVNVSDTQHTKQC